MPVSVSNPGPTEVVDGTPGIGSSASMRKSIGANAPAETGRCATAAGGGPLSAVMSRNASVPARW